MLKNHSEMQIRKDAKFFFCHKPTFRANLKKFEKCKFVLMQMLADVLNWLPTVSEKDLIRETLRKQLFAVAVGRINRLEKQARIPLRMP